MIHHKKSSLIPEQEIVLELIKKPKETKGATMPNYPQDKCHGYKDFRRCVLYVYLFTRTKAQVDKFSKKGSPTFHYSVSLKKVSSDIR